MPFRRQPRLRVLVPGTLILTALLVSVVLQSRHTMLAKQEMTRIEVLNLKAIAEPVQTYCRHLWRAEDREALRYEFAALRLLPEITQAVLLDERNTVLYATEINWIGQPLNRVWPLQEYDSQTETHRQQIASTMTGDAWLIPGSTAAIGYFPVMLASTEAGPEARGLLIVTKNLKSSLEVAEVHVRRLGLETGLLLFGLALVAWAFFHFSLEERVEQLVSAVRQFSAGHRRVPLKLPGNDEIGEIGRALNEMMETIEHSQRQLIDSEAHYRQLVEISPVAVLIHQEGRVTLVNQEFERLIGASREELLGRSPLEFVPTEQRPILAERIRMLLAERKRLPQVEIEILRADGTRIDVERQAAAVPLADGGAAVLVVLKDISDRRRAEEERRNSEIQVRNILDTAMDGIITIDESQRVIIFNASAERIFGYPAEQMLGESIDRLIPERFRFQHRTMIDDFGRETIPARRMGAHRRVLALRNDGDEFPIEASISQATSHGRKLYTVIVRDVSESEQHQRQIEQQIQMLDQVSDAVSVLDLTGRIRFCNSAAHRLFGWSTDEVIGCNADELWDRGHEGLLADIQHEANMGQAWAGEMTKATRQNSTVLVEHRRSILRDQAGTPVGYLCLDIDISDRKKREILSRRSQRLESIGMLAGGIAHDLNNMLTPLLMGAKLLASGHVRGDQQGLLDTMVASAERGAGLIRQLLSFAGGIRGERGPVRIDELVAETRNLLDHSLPKSICIETTVDPNCSSVCGDTTELSQALMNLCINARDAMPNGGTLTIQATSLELGQSANRLHPDAQTGPYVLLKVTDTGVGMTPEVLDKIFDPFFTTKEFGLGTGLGLATVGGIVKSYGGFIIVYSEPGHGSTFSIYLPAETAAPSSVSRPVSEHCSQPGLGRTVLVVDDEEFIRETVTLVLEAAGYRVLTAADGLRAVELLSEQKHTISAVLLDMMMPGQDGLQTLDRMREIDPQVRIIACSGLYTSQREAGARQHGANDFLAKPFSDEQFLKVLETVLQQPVEQSVLPYTH